ncbi:MAG: hypothetical protein M9963_07775 [Kiritimatiellae bacterium]|nr:hypothetical protein [Kiritimatiellia bacterium]MCO5061889.1 hypothetical protein [Kiritimatiellia bacterium]MCO6401276.1 hypothetical protein [Verrucomicrobiota bacterium]
MKKFSIAQSGGVSGEARLEEGVRLSVALFEFSGATIAREIAGALAQRAGMGSGVSEGVSPERVTAV